MLFTTITNNKPESGEYGWAFIRKWTHFFVSFLSPVDKEQSGVVELCKYEFFSTSH